MSEPYTPSLAQLIVALETEAERRHAVARSIERAAAQLQRPGEMATKRDLERRARSIDHSIFQIRSAVRAIKGEPANA